MIHCVWTSQSLGKDYQGHQLIHQSEKLDFDKMWANSRGSAFTHLLMD